MELFNIEAIHSRNTVDVEDQHKKFRGKHSIIQVCTESADSCQQGISLNLIATYLVSDPRPPGLFTGWGPEPTTYRKISANSSTASILGSVLSGGRAERSPVSYN